MPAEYTQNLLTLSREYDFVISGGSDYHGLNKDDVRMGTGKNSDLNIPDEFVKQLKEAKRKKFETLNV